MNPIHNKLKINPMRTNFWQDLLMLLLLFAATLTAFTDTRLHKWLGIGMTVAMSMHVVLHWCWLEAVSRRFIKKMAYQLRLKLILNLTLLVAFLLLMFSGMIVSLIFAPGVTVFHTVCFYLFICLTTLHLALNWKWITRSGRRFMIMPFIRFATSVLHPLPIPGALFSAHPFINTELTDEPEGAMKIEVPQ